MRGIARHSAKTLGNFWVDLVRTTYYLLLPICVVFAVVLVSQGMIQNFKPYTKAKLAESFTIQVPKVDEKGQPVTTNVAVVVHAPRLDAQSKPVLANGVAVIVDMPQFDAKGQPLMTNLPVMVDQKVEEQTIVQGPMASQVAIKMFGTNGGGYVNANAAHPFENPTPLSNFLQMLSIFAIGSGLTYYLGRMTKNQAHGWAVWSAMTALFLAGVLIAWWAESAGNPIHQHLGIAVADGNMEGKEVLWHFNPRCSPRSRPTPRAARSIDARFVHRAGRAGAAVQHSTRRNHLRQRGRGALWHARVCRPRGFIAGLMVGRTPEYLGKNSILRGKDAMLALLVLCLSIFGFSAWRR